MTNENRQEAAKYVEDLMERTIGNALGSLFPTGSNADVVRHHMRAVLNGTILRTLEKAMQSSELPEEERLALIIKYLQSHPDYLPAGVLPLTSDEAESDEGDFHLIARVRDELGQMLSKLLPSQFPGLVDRIKPGGLLLSESKGEGEGNEG